MNQEKFKADFEKKRPFDKNVTSKEPTEYYIDIYCSTQFGKKAREVRG